MALPILDGNQQATTLSTILISGEHTTAHTVVSLGAQAIANIATAVSGSVVSISNYPATQTTTFGAVTGSVSVLNFPASQAVTFSAVSISNFPATQSTTFGAITGSISVLNFPATQAISISSVTIGNSITIGSVPPISGSVTLGAGNEQIGSVTISNVQLLNASVATDGLADATLNFVKIGGHQDGSNQIGHIVHVSGGGAMKVDASDSTVTFGAVQLRAGTTQIGSVTASISGTIPISISSVTIGNFPAIQPVSLTSLPALTGSTAQIGSVTASISGTIPISIASVTIGNSVTIGSLPALVAGIAQIGSVTASISGTVPISISSVTIGNAISISNFPATQSTTFGAVSGSVSILNYPASQAVTFSAVSISNFPATQPVSIASVTIGSLPLIAGTVTANINIFPDATTIGEQIAQGFTNYGGFDVVIAGTANVSGTVTIGSLPEISGTVTVGNSVTIGSLPAISGTVTAMAGTNFSDEISEGILNFQDNEGGFDIGSLPAISGTVTANIGNAVDLIGGGYSNFVDLLANDTIAVRELPAISGTVTVVNTVTIAGTVTANPTGTQTIAGSVTIGAGTAQIGSVTASISNFPATQPVSIASVTIGSLPLIAGTVTANLANVVIEDSFWGVPAIKVTGGDGYGIDIAGLDSNASRAILMEGGGIPVYPRDDAGLGAPFPVAGTVTVGNSVTIGSLPAISGTVTANNTNLNRLVQNGDSTGTFGVPLAYAQVAGGELDFFKEVNQVLGLPIRNDANPLVVSGTVTVGNSVTIAGVVTANTFALQGTAVTTSNFTSTTASTLLAGFNAGRQVLTIFNEGASNLFVCAGATCTTIAYQVRLSAGDYFEVPNHQTTITHSAVFATAGTARVTEVS